jgi:hypothetical protein
MQFSQKLNPNQAKMLPSREAPTTAVESEKSIGTSLSRKSFISLIFRCDLVWILIFGCKFGIGFYL